MTTGRHDYETVDEVETRSFWIVDAVAQVMDDKRRCLLAAFTVSASMCPIMEDPQYTQRLGNTPPIYITDIGISYCSPADVCRFDLTTGELLALQRQITSPLKFYHTDNFPWNDLVSKIFLQRLICLAQPPRWVEHLYDLKHIIHIIPYEQGKHLTPSPLIRKIWKTNR